MSGMDDEPRVHLSPAVRAQLDEDRPQLFGIPVRTVPSMTGDAILLMSRAVMDAEARAWMNGMVLGPFKFETHRDVNEYRVTCTAEFIPRGTATE